jgi:hypothetical protein
MTTQAKQNFITPFCTRVQTLQDFQLVSAFALWAVLLGLSPVLAFNLMWGN